MIPLTFLYEEYIDRPKLSEQKNPFEYIVPTPTSGVGTITRKSLRVLSTNWLSTKRQFHTSKKFNNQK